MELQTSNEFILGSGGVAIVGFFLKYHFNLIQKNTQALLEQVAKSDKELALMAQRLEALTIVKDELMDELKALKAVKQDVDWLKREMSAIWKKHDEYKAKMTSDFNTMRERTHDLANNLNAALLKLHLNTIELKKFKGESTQELNEKG